MPAEEVVMYRCIYRDCPVEVDERRVLELLPDEIAPFQVVPLCDEHFTLVDAWMNGEASRPTTRQWDRNGRMTLIGGIQKEWSR
jgi:hypothetical protein